MLTTSSFSSSYCKLIPLTMYNTLAFAKERWEERHWTDPKEDLVQFFRVWVLIYTRDLPRSVLLSRLALCLFFQKIWPRRQCVLSPLVWGILNFLGWSPIIHLQKSALKSKGGKLLVWKFSKNVFLTKMEEVRSK